jgi:hypothetical protein
VNRDEDIQLLQFASPRDYQPYASFLFPRNRQNLNFWSSRHSGTLQYIKKTASRKAGKLSSIRSTFNTDIWSQFTFLRGQNIGGQSLTSLLVWSESQLHRPVVLRNNKSPPQDNKSTTTSKPPHMDRHKISFILAFAICGICPFHVQRISTNLRLVRVPGRSLRFLIIIVLFKET